MRMTRRHTAFSLVELLVVIAVIGLLAVGSLVAVSGIRAGRNLNQAGILALDQFALARQNAVSKNARVRWLIVSVADARNGDPEAFRKIRLEIFDPAGRAWKPLGRPVTFPVSVVADPAGSTLLTNTAAGATNAVTFLANGRTQLNPNTVHSLTLSDGKNINNFITIQLDPVSGRCRTFQP
ncbi:MAG TPA: GspH/FimT family pseudopilin [Terrimicrobiaceae bacterium]|nr:GspH/FimT family pseudopilin [Terrimicrobiaceae bacterium]